MYIYLERLHIKLGLTVTLHALYDETDNNLVFIRIRMLVKGNAHSLELSIIYILSVCELCTYP